MWERQAVQVQTVSELEEKLATQLDLHQDTVDTHLAKYSEIQRRYDRAQRDRVHIFLSLYSATPKRLAGFFTGNFERPGD